MCDKIEKLSIIPSSKLEHVKKALKKTFNTINVDEISLLTGGLSSALVYKIVVNETSYVLRIIMHIDQLSDPNRQFLCTQLASDAGIAPHLYYSSVEDALSIHQFIETKPLSESFSTNQKLSGLVKTIKAIHKLPLFPKLVNFLDGIDMFIQQFKSLNILPEEITKEHFEYYSQIQRFYPRYDSDIVSSHNDLNPNNILCDGNRIWIVDWEAAFQNDRYVDLALVSNFFINDDLEEQFYLKEYFGDELDEYKKARFFLMKQCCHMYYAMIILKFASAIKNENSVHDDSLDIISLKEFRKLVSLGKINLRTYENQLLFGKAILNELLSNMKTEKFLNSIKIFQDN